MGWTSYHASFYKNNGSVDRKAELDYLYRGSVNHDMFIIRKSSMIGSTYYAAIEIAKKRGEYHEEKKEYDYIDIPVDEREIVPVVIITTTDMKDYFNFCYKDVGIWGYYDCPKGILDLIKTDDESTLKWIAKCNEERAKKNSSIIKNLPIGATVEWTKHNGEKVILLKHAPAYQFKTWFWYNMANNCYVKKNLVREENIKVIA